MVSQAGTRLLTQPPRVAVTTDQTKTWSIDFANALKPGQVILQVNATLYRISPTPKVAVNDFVQMTAVDGTKGLVGWTGTPLTEGHLYRLEVAALLSDSTVEERAIMVECGF